MPEPQTEAEITTRAGLRLFTNVDGSAADFLKDGHREGYEAFRSMETWLPLAIAAIEAEARNECKAQLDRAEAVVAAARVVEEHDDEPAGFCTLPGCGFYELRAALAAYDGAGE